MRVLWVILQGLTLLSILWLKPFHFNGLSAHSLKELGFLSGIAVIISGVWQLPQIPSAWKRPLLFAVVAGVFWVVPTYLRKPSQPVIPPQVDELANWAKTSTPLDSVFLFPDSQRDKKPGYFRFLAERAVYVDWKGGGQMNFSRIFAEEWWRRWQATMEKPLDVNVVKEFKAPPLDFVVTQEGREIPGLELVNKTRSFNVYRISE